jgi:hypothetical protein
MFSEQRSSAAIKAAADFLELFSISESTTLSVRGGDLVGWR